MVLVCPFIYSYSLTVVHEQQPDVWGVMGERSILVVFFPSDIKDAQLTRWTIWQALEVITKDAETPGALPIFYNSDDNQFYAF